MKIAVFPGDGIGPEIIAQAIRVLEALDLPGLELIEGEESVGKYLDKDTLGEGEEAFEGTH